MRSDKVTRNITGNENLEAETNARVGLLRSEANKRSTTKPQNDIVWCGLRNLGNSCYLNSVVQCLAAVDDALCVGLNSVSMEYGQLVRKLKRKEQAVITPSRLKREIGKGDIRFANKEPQDAHELLAGLLDLMKGESVAKRSIGRYLSTVRCMSCSFESSTEVEEQCISLPLVSKPNVTVHDCLKEYFAAEAIPLSEGVRCYGCGHVVSAQKTLTIETSPELLLIHLKRFAYVDGRMKKVETNVGVPSNVAVPGAKYQLAGVVKHSGSKNSGHYVADIRTKMGWLTLDDDLVKKTKGKRMSWCPYSYLLFYIKENVNQVPDTPSDRRAPPHL